MASALYLGRAWAGRAGGEPVWGGWALASSTSCCRWGCAGAQHNHLVVLTTRATSVPFAGKKYLLQGHWQSSAVNMDGAGALLINPFFFLIVLLLRRLPEKCSKNFRKGSVAVYGRSMHLCSGTCWCCPPLQSPTAPTFCWDLVTASALKSSWSRRCHKDEHASNRWVFPDCSLDSSKRPSGIHEEIWIKRGRRPGCPWGLHQLLAWFPYSLHAAVLWSLLSHWWLWFLLCLFSFTPLLNLLLLDFLLLLAPDKLLPLISLKLLPLTNL